MYSWGYSLVDVKRPCGRKCFRRVYAANFRASEIGAAACHERRAYLKKRVGRKVASNPKPPMKNKTDQSFFDEPVDLRAEARALALEVICRLLIWIADGTTVEDRGLRATVALYCVRPDLLKGITLEEIGERSGMSRQGIFKLAADFRETTGLRS